MSHIGQTSIQNVESGATGLLVVVSHMCSPSQRVGNVGKGVELCVVVIWN